MYNLSRHHFKNIYTTSTLKIHVDRSIRLLPILPREDSRPLPSSDQFILCDSISSPKLLNILSTIEFVDRYRCGFLTTFFSICSSCNQVNSNLLKASCSHVIKYLGSTYTIPLCTVSRGSPISSLSIIRSAPALEVSSRLPLSSSSSRPYRSSRPLLHSLPSNPSPRMAVKDPSGGPTQDYICKRQRISAWILWKILHISAYSLRDSWSTSPVRNASAPNTATLSPIPDSHPTTMPFKLPLLLCFTLFLRSAILSGAVRNQSSLRQLCSWGRACLPA